MRITLDVELHESDLSNAAHISKALESLGGTNVETRFVTDKAALASRIKEAIAKRKYDLISDELTERLCQPAMVDDCVEVLCSSALFSTQRAEQDSPVMPFIDVISRLPGLHKEKVKSEVVQRAMVFLSTPRRLDCSRIPLLPYAEVLAALVKAELLHVRSALNTMVLMIRQDTTRTAGMTCVGKLIEVAYDMVRMCDTKTLKALRSSVAIAQQNDTFLYDVEYIMDGFGRPQNKSCLAISRHVSHHKHPILSLAYCGGTGSNWREAVVTSSVDGTISTWDCMGTLTEDIVLSRHYASSLDFGNRGHTLIVGTVGRHPNIAPAVVLYSEEGNSHEPHWDEHTAVEPQNAWFITAVRSIRTSPSLRYCVGVSTATSHLMLLYDRTQLVQEYHDHADILTAMHIPSDRDSTVITGSRDCSIMVYDLRSRQSAATFSHHSSTVSAIGTCGNYLFTAGLDKRVVMDDMRMVGNQPMVRDMDSAVLSMSVSGSMQCAVATMTGACLIDFASGTAMPTTVRAECGMVTPRYNAIAWNSLGSALYAGGDNMTLDVYARQYPETDVYDGA